MAALDTYTLSAARYDVFPQRARHAAVAIAIVLHAIAIVLLWRLEPVRSAVVDAARDQARGTGSASPEACRATAGRHRTHRSAVTVRCTGASTRSATAGRKSTARCGAGT